MSKLLIVDDNPFYRRRLDELFAADGHEVETAGDAVQAIAVARSQRPDVLVVDRMLRADLDGFDVARALRAELPRLRTIVITGYPSTNVEREARKLDCYAYFEKPFDPEELRTAVREAAAADTEG